MYGVKLRSLFYTTLLDKLGSHLSVIGVIRYEDNVFYYITGCALYVKNLDEINEIRE